LKKINWQRIKHEIAALFARALLRVMEQVHLLLHGRNRKGEQQRAGSTLTVWLAAALLTIMTLLAFCIPLRPTYSELELRDLAAFPSPTVETVLDGTFFSDISTWFADTFPFREQFVALSSRIESLHGFQSAMIHGDVETGDDIPTVPAVTDGSDASGTSQAPTDSSAPADPDASTGTTSEAPLPELPDLDDDATIEKTGALLQIDDAAYEYYNFKSDVATAYIQTIERAASKLAGKAKVYDLIAPSSIDICVPEKVRSELNTSSQKDALDYFYSSFSSRVTGINVYATLLEHSAAGEYLYFRTDHHWTALAAYYAYCQFADVAGCPKADLETDFTMHTFDGFLGSFYRDTNSSAMRSNPDTVYAYEPVDTNTINIHWPDGTATDYNIITDVSTWSASSKYSSAFIGGDEPYSMIENPNISDGSSILLVKESYGNCFAPFLVESYQYVYIADYRHYSKAESGTLADLVEREGIQNVLFLNTISSTRSSSLVTQLATFVG
jgi:hypothetical protein